MEIRDVGVFQTQTLPLQVIKGLRVFETQYGRTVVLEPSQPGFKKMKTGSMLERSEALFIWLEYNFPNLDKQERR